jgi:hypothetical protein
MGSFCQKNKLKLRREGPIVANFHLLPSGSSFLHQVASSFLCFPLFVCRQSSFPSFSFYSSYIISLGVHKIQLLLDPNTSIATLSSTFA